MGGSTHPLSNIFSRRGHNYEIRQLSSLCGTESEIASTNGEKSDKNQ
jgi:hypothetical protein